jgi:indole-3-glycerol phosphate synthase
MNILTRLTEAAKTRVERDKKNLPLPELERICAAMSSGSKRFAFEKKIAEPGMSFICEIKRASPSKGVIAEHFPYLGIALDYEAAEASCVSVLTEPDYFMGSDRYLEEIASVVGLPVLRKDFIIDPYQIYQARLLGAGAVLLICALLEPARLKEYTALADSLGLSALVEARDEREIETALTSGTRVIGVNNRDLTTFEVDPQNSARRSRGFIYLVSSLGVTGVRDEIGGGIQSIISEIRRYTDTPIAVGFGIHTPEQAGELSRHADGVIVGSAIVSIIAEQGSGTAGKIADYVRLMKANMPPGAEILAAEGCDGKIDIA